MLNLKAVAGDCSRFTLCIDGTVNTFRCPRNYLFDEKLGFCNFATSVRNQTACQYYPGNP